MTRRKKFLPFFALSIISFLIVGGMIVFTDPFVELSVIYFSALPISFFFFFLFLGVFSLFLFLLTNPRRALLITAYVVGIFVLRYFGFTSFIHIAFLFIILALIELFFALR